MGIAAYFDCSWEGPEVQTNDKGDITSKGDVKSMRSILFVTAMAFA